MKVQICAPEGWLDAVASARRRHGHADLAVAILKLCHSSALGVPVSTAFGFAGWISGGSASAGIWDALFPVHILRSEGYSISSLASRLALRPFDATRLLLFPVAARVQAELGEAQIFAGIAGGSPLDVNLVTRFEARLALVLGPLDQHTVQTSGELRAWRNAIAIRCLQFLRAAEGGEMPSTDPDPEAAELFLGAAMLQDSESSRHSTEPQPILSKTRVSHRFQSDGIEGIRHARPSEDPSSMLPSQMVYPAAILAERIANEGFMAYERPPQLPDRQRHVVCVLVYVKHESRPLSAARAAFWTVAQSVEADYCRDLGTLAFAWLPIGRKARKATSLVHRPEPGARLSSDQTALTWLQNFNGLGSPFLAGPRPPAIGQAPRQSWPEDVSQPLWDANLPIGVNRAEPLKLHVTVVTDMTEDESKLHMAGVDIGIGALQPAEHSTTWLHLSGEPDRVTLDTADSFDVGDDFAAASQAVRDLAQLWKLSITRVLRHG